MLKLFVGLNSLIILLALTACGGGGSGDNNGDIRAVGGTGDQFLVLANVSKNGCGERISAVHQTFTVSSDRINTSLVTVPVTATSTGFVFSFTDTNGDCTRTYKGTFSNVSGSAANVELTSDTACANQTCQDAWSGTASKL